MNDLLTLQQQSRPIRIPLCRVPSSGPSFPADEESTVPFSISAKEATAMASSYEGTLSKPNEIEMASTPSTIVWSMAAKTLEA